MLREPVPEKLRRRVDAVLAAHGASAGDDPAVLVRVAVDVAGDLLEPPLADRPMALDLLVVDALVTRALELMTGDPDAFDDRCRAAMRALAAVTGAS